MSLRRVSPEHALTVAQGRHQEDPGRLQPRPSMWNSYTYISPICMTLRYHTWMIWARSFQAEAIKCQMPNRPAHVCIAGALVVARTSACVKCKRSGQIWDSQHLLGEVSKKIAVAESPQTLSMRLDLTKCRRTTHPPGYHAGRWVPVN